MPRSDPGIADSRLVPVTELRQGCAGATDMQQRNEYRGMAASADRPIRCQPAAASPNRNPHVVEELPRSTLEKIAKNVLRDRLPAIVR